MLRPNFPALKWTFAHNGAAAAARFKVSLGGGIKCGDSGRVEAFHTNMYIVIMDTHLLARGFS